MLIDIVECGEDEYQCRTGDCIPNSYLCDDILNDCEENEDESEEVCGDNGNKLKPRVKRPVCKDILFCFSFYRVTMSS